MKFSLLSTLAIVVLPFFLQAQAAGSLDSTFNQTGIVQLRPNDYGTRMHRVRLQPDNKIVCFGYVLEEPSYNYRIAVFRFKEDGSPDPGFGINGVSIVGSPSDVGCDGYILPDGKILVIGLRIPTGFIKVMRLLPDGSPDPSFGLNGSTTVNPGVFLNGTFLTAMQSDGKILAYGKHSTVTGNNFITRILPNGQIDTDYGEGGTRLIDTPANGQLIKLYGGGIQPDGKLIQVGRTGTAAALSKWYLTRLTLSGDIDSTFGTNGVAIKDLGSVQAEEAFDVLFLPDNRIIVGGYALKSPGFHFTMIRINPDGSTDNTFGLGGKAQIAMNSCCFSSIFGLARQADGKLLACGYVTDDLVQLSMAVARFSANGVVDQQFGDAGKVILQLAPQTLSHRAFTMAIQDDNKILVLGTSDIDGIDHSGILVRLNPGEGVGAAVPEKHPVADLSLFPNPTAENSLRVQYTLTASAPVRLVLYDLAGRRLANLLETADREPGLHQESVELPIGLSPGAYLLHLETASGDAVIKLFKTM